jgi:RND family efflux transporter MFP subunit
MHLMKHILAAIPFALLISSCGGGKQETRKAVNPPDTIPVKVERIDSSVMSAAISASGVITTENETRLSFKIGGVIQQVHVEEGQRVRQGQLLASLNTTEIDAQVRQVQLSLEKAQRDNQRATNLYRDSVATLEQMQNSRTGVEIARQNVQQARFNQQYARIYAPQSGFVVRKLLNAGEVAGPGSPVLVMNELSGNSRWILRAGVSDREWSAIAVGNTAEITMDAYPGRIFRGVVSSKSLAADPASGSFRVEIQVNPDGVQPAAGMFGKAVITPSVSARGYSIPYESLLEANGSKGFVFVTDDRRTVRRVEVTIARMEGQRVYVSEGLAGHSLVVTSGSPYLAEGSVIKITGEHN